MKKIYSRPEVEINEFKCEDIITTSGINSEVFTISNEKKATSIEF